MSKDDKTLDENNKAPVPQDRSVSVGKMLYSDDPASFREDEDNNTDDGFNERLRDLDVEMQEQEKNQTLEQEEQELSISEEEASYERDRERGFDPLTHQQETKKELHVTEEEREQDVEAELSGFRKRGRKKSKFSFLNKLKLKLMVSAFQKAVKQSMGAAKKTLEAITTYKHFSITTPGSQAGIFDNTIEDNKEAAKETIIKAAAAKHFLGEGLQALQQAQEAAEHAAQRAATPYTQNLQHAKEALDAVSSVKESVKGTSDILQQGVSKENLGSLDHNVRVLGMNIAGKDTSRGM